MHCFFAAFALVPAVVQSCPPQLQVFQWCQVLLFVSHCHFSTQIRMVLISVTFSASYISDITCSKGNSFVMCVTVVLLFCYCQQCIMALVQFDCLKELSVSPESYDSDDYSTEHFTFFRGVIIFLKTLKLLHIADVIGPSLGSTVNTSTFTHCSILLCNNSVRCTYSLYMEEFPTILLHMQRIRISLSNCFIQQQIIHSLMMDL